MNRRDFGGVTFAFETKKNRDKRTNYKIMKRDIVEHASFGSFASHFLGRAYFYGQEYVVTRDGNVFFIRNLFRGFIFIFHECRATSKDSGSKFREGRAQCECTRGGQT